MKKKNFVLFLFFLTVLLTLTVCQQPSASQTSEVEVVDTLPANTPEEAIAKLLAGNQRFVAEHSIYPNSRMERVIETSPHQAPFAAVVGCSDSRVPVELLFDQGIGDIFVIRTAGNNVSSDAVMGSVEYAVEHLGVKVLLVLGHGSCGGVTSAISPEEAHGSIGNLLKGIRADVSKYVGQPDSLDAAIRSHASIQVERIKANPHASHMIANGKLLVKQAYYDVHSGRVTIE